MVHQAVNCPNCGDKDWNDEKKGFECRKCGFKKPEMNELPSITLCFCPACGCHYLGGCSTHESSTQVYVKPQVPSK